MHFCSDTLSPHILYSNDHLLLCENITLLHKAATWRETYILTRGGRHDSEPETRQDVIKNMKEYGGVIMNSFLSKFISKYRGKIATGVMILMLCLSMIATDTAASSASSTSGEDEGVKIEELHHTATSSASSSEIISAASSSREKAAGSGGRSGGPAGPGNGDPGSGGSKLYIKTAAYIVAAQVQTVFSPADIQVDTSADQKNIDFVQRDFNFLISDPAQDNKKACKPLSLQAFSTGAPDWEAKSL